MACYYLRVKNLSKFEKLPRTWFCSNHGQAEVWTCSMYTQLGSVAWPGQAAWTRRMDIQHGDMDKEYGHAPWTHNMDMSIGIQDEHANGHA
jgi:hypothetical protein